MERKVSVPTVEQFKKMLVEYHNTYGFNEIIKKYNINRNGKFYKWWNNSSLETAEEGFDYFMLHFTKLGRLLGNE